MGWLELKTTNVNVFLLDTTRGIVNSQTLGIDMSYCPCCQIMENMTLDFAVCSPSVIKLQPQFQRG